jgi:hypothetical protein
LDLRRLWDTKVMDNSLHAQRNRAAVFRAHLQARRTAALASLKPHEIAQNKGLGDGMTALPKTHGAHSKPAGFSSRH